MDNGPIRDAGADEQPVVKQKKRNKGEIGEILSVFLLLVRPAMKFHNLNKERIVKEVKFCNNSYRIENESLIITTPTENFTKSKSQFELLFNKCLSEHSHGPVPSLNEFKQYIELTLDKSSLKVDTEILFADSETLEGYSIKSFGGASPTLLNASRQTLFEYEIKNSHQNLDPSLIKLEEKIQDKISKLKELNPFHENDPSISIGAKSNTFKENLNLVEPNYSLYLGHKLLSAYSQGLRDLKDIFTSESEKNNIKELLWMSCMGMVPRRLYQLENGNNSGIILFDGCFNYFLQGDQELKDFLYEHSKLDTPSTTRYRMVDGFESSADKLTFGLTLQIRIKYPRNLFDITNP